MLFFIHFTWSWVYYGTWQLDATHMLKFVTTKSYMQFNQCLAFEPHKPYVILAEYEIYLRLPSHFIWIKIPDGYQIASSSFELRLPLHFIWIKIPDGYQIASSSLKKSLGLCSTSQLSLWIWSFRLKNGVSFRCLLSKVISFILSSLYVSIVYWYYPYLWLYVRFDFLGIWFCS